MSSLAQLTRQTSRPEMLVGILGILAMAGYAIWAAIRWARKQPLSPDPWDEQVAADLADPDCPPLCHHCLEPHELSAYFCRNCGAAVGAYTNLLPYPYLFSIGHALRIGTTERFRKTPLVICGFILLGLIEYVWFAPVYWGKFLLNFGKPARPPAPAPPASSPNGPPAKSP